MSQTILVVEDNPITRKMLRVSLESEGYDVAEAGDARSALAVAAARRPALLILDYVLPDMDGLELLAEIRRRARSPELPALVVTGMLSHLEDLRTKNSEFTQFLPKPIEPSRLLEVVGANLSIPGGRGAGKYVLVVDDDPVNLKLAALQLKRAGYEVETASGGEEGLKKARQRTPDAVLSDVLMPSMDGFTFCSEIRRDKSLAGVPVVLSSLLYVQGEDKELARKMGANALVVRTGDLHDAIAALEESLGAPPPPVPEIPTALHRERLQVQIGRQKERNDVLLRQAAIQATALTVMRGLSEALAQPREVPKVIGDVLVQCLDASGLSRGLLYLVEDGRHRLEAHSGLPSDARKDAEACFGHPELVRRVVESSQPMSLSRDSPDAAIRGFLSHLGQSALLVPFVILGQSFGVLVLASDTEDLSEGAWVGFGRSLALQFGQTVALGQSLTRLAVSEARYRALMEEANDAILILDLPHRILDVNRQAERLLGRPREAIVGRSYNDFVVPEQRDDSTQRQERLLAEGTLRVESRLFLRPDGTVPVDVSASIVRLNEEPVVLAMLRDMTEATRADQRLAAHHLATRILSETATLAEATPKILKALGEMLRWDMAALWTVNREGTALWCSELWCASRPALAEIEALNRETHILRGAGLPGRVWLSGVAAWMSALSIDSGLPRIAAAQRAGLRTACAFPIRFQGEVVGVVEFLSRDARRADHELDKMMLDVASQIAPFWQRRRAEKALRAAQQRLNHLVASSPAVLYSLKFDGKRKTATWVSDNIFRITGNTSRETLEPNWWASRLHPEDKDRVLSDLSVLLSEGHLSREYRLLHENRTYVWIRDEQVLIRDYAGQPVEVVGSWSDITARKQAELKLRESEEQYRLLFDLSPQPMWVYDDESLAFLAVNNAAIRHYGYSREEFLSMTLRDIRPAHEVGFLEEHVRARRGTGPPMAFEAARVWKHLLKSGAVIDVQIAASPIEFQGHQAWLTLVSDVTEKKRLEAQFLQAQKMESVGQLAGGVAHDFNNLLTVIMSYSDILLRQFDAADPAREKVEQIYKSGERAATLTRQLLIFSRKQLFQPKVLDLNVIVGEMGAMLRRLIGEDVELVTVVREGLGHVKADPGQIEQILMNLAVNARDAMPTGGRLIIETSDVELDDSYASEHGSVRPGRYVMLAVTDTGGGMDEGVQEHIFEPFFTTKGPGKGTGLGLATVYGIVKQSEGSIWVYSEQGRGTTFKIYLPRVDEPYHAPRTPKIARLPRGTETILVVENEEALREITHEILAGQGYTVLDARSGAAALELVQGQTAPLDLLLTDVVMPGISGRELAEKLSVRYPGLKVLFMSGYTDDAIVRHGILEEGTAFIQKPFTLDSLSTKVREVLDFPRG